jgi:hypothetical protein
MSGTSILNTLNQIALLLLQWNSFKHTILKPIIDKCWIWENRLHGFVGRREAICRFESRTCGIIGQEKALTDLVNYLHNWYDYLAAMERPLEFGAAQVPYPGFPYLVGPSGSGKSTAAKLLAESVIMNPAFSKYFSAGTEPIDETGHIHSHFFPARQGATLCDLFEMPSDLPLPTFAMKFRHGVVLMDETDKSAAPREVQESLRHLANTGTLSGPYGSEVPASRILIILIGNARLEDLVNVAPSGTSSSTEKSEEDSSDEKVELLNHDTSSTGLSDADIVKGRTKTDFDHSFRNLLIPVVFNDLDGDAIKKIVQNKWEMHKQLLLQTDSVFVSMGDCALEAIITATRESLGGARDIEKHLSQVVMPKIRTLLPKCTWNVTFACGATLGWEDGYTITPSECAYLNFSVPACWGGVDSCFLRDYEECGTDPQQLEVVSTSQDKLHYKATLPITALEANKLVLVFSPDDRVKIYQTKPTRQTLEAESQLFGRDLPPNLPLFLNRYIRQVVPVDNEWANITWVIQHALRHLNLDWLADETPQSTPSDAWKWIHEKYTDIVQGTKRVEKPTMDAYSPFEIPEEDQQRGLVQKAWGWTKSLFHSSPPAEHEHEA